MGESLPPLVGESLPPLVGVDLKKRERNTRNKIGLAEKYLLVHKTFHLSWKFEGSIYNAQHCRCQKYSSIQRHQNKLDACLGFFTPSEVHL